MNLEERKRKLAEARAAREAKDKQVVELGEQLVKMQATAAPTAAVSAPMEVSPVRVAPVVAKPASPSPAPAFVERKVAVVDIPPVAPPKAECYSKGINTDVAFVYAEERPHPSEVTMKGEASTEEENKMGGTEPELGATLGVTMGRLGGMVWDKSASSSKLLRNRNFLDFIDTASGVMGSALGSDQSAPVNIFSSAAKAKSTSALAKRGSFLNEATSRDQMVIVAIAFQPGSTESFAVSYGTGEHPGSTLEGRLQDVVSVWNTRRSLPVNLQFKYEIHALAYSPFHPHYLFGGSAKGHIVLWDTRSSSVPVATTFPSLNSHNMPITYLRVVGDGSKNSLVSVSLDGRVCMWNVEDLKHPVASMIVCSANSDAARMSITASCVPHSREGKEVETSRVYLAAPKGTLHTATRTAVDRRIIPSQLSSTHHEGTINSIDCHPFNQDSTIANLILTSSSDWSCRIWLGESSVKVGLQDMVLDAKWSPTHPSLFAACDASGKVTLWNMVRSTQAPIGTIKLEDSTAPGGKGPVILHRLAWDDGGEHLIVGGNQGETYYIAVHVEDSDEGGDALVRWVSRNLASGQ